MSIAKRPSKITLPNLSERWPTVLAFLVDKFAHIKPEQWQQRMADGKVHWIDGTLIDVDTSFLPGKVVCYYREVASEPTIPFSHQVIYQNEHLVVVDKPHFLQVTPGGSFVNETLLARVQRQLNNDDIVPVHRLDRDTAGLVLFSTNPDSRAKYFDLFARQRIHKQYQAVAKLSGSAAQMNLPRHWRVENRIKSNKSNSLNHQVTVDSMDKVNAKSDLSLVEKSSNRGLFKLTPYTGKTHQLRLHMLNIGMPILNDRYYPEYKPREQAENYSHPLQLLAQSLSFTDPVTGHLLNFNSRRELQEAPA